MYYLKKNKNIIHNVLTNVIICAKVYGQERGNGKNH